MLRKTDVDKCTYSEMVVNLGNPRECDPTGIWPNFLHFIRSFGSGSTVYYRVSVQGVKSLGGHFARLCRGFDFYEVKKMLLFFKKKRETLLHF
jgi:hypothetical protein